MEILRKLTPLEDIFNFYTQETKSLIFPTTFIIESNIDLFHHHKITSQSIEIWKDLHPLLSSSLKKISNDFFLIKNNENKKNNVHFLKPSDTNSLNWLLIHRSQFMNSFQLETDLLWRLFIVELDSNLPNGCFKYSFTINIHHSISDASNNFAIIAELLGLIEKNLTKKLHLSEEQRFANSEFELNFPNDPRFGLIDPNTSLEQFIDYEKQPLLPEYFKHGLKFNICSNSNGKFTYLNGKDYATFVDLEQQINDSSTGYEFKKISHSALKKLYDKCKVKNLKLNSIFEVISSIAFKKISEKFSGKSCSNETNKYEVTINMRPFLNISNNVMGCWVSFFEGELDLDFEETDEIFWSIKFWSLCEKKCQALHNNLNNREFLSKEVAEGSAILCKILKNGQRFKNYAYNYAISNMGDKSNQALGDMFKIKEYYTGLSYNVDNEFGLLATCSINFNSFWSFSYCRNLFCDEAAKLFMDSIEEYILKASQ